MATRILIPTPLRPFTDKQDAVEAEGKTIGELLADLTAKHSGLKAHLYNDQGKLRSFVNVYVNDDDIRYLQKEETPVAPGDTVIVESVDGNGAVTVLEQNSPEHSPVTRTQLFFTSGTATSGNRTITTTVSGTIRFYRPEAR